jgi:hypothetical protein
MMNQEGGAMAMKEQIERTLHPLIGVSFWGAGRAADMETFQVGPRHPVTDRHGRTRDVGTYALHVQCAWRIVGPRGIVVASRGIVVASRDRYYPSEASGLDVSDPDFEWDRAGANLCDERRARFFAEHYAVPLLVKEVRADDVESVGLILGGYELEVFPDDSQDGEHWRFFQPHTDGDHVVVTGAGVEE